HRRDDRSSVDLEDGRTDDLPPRSAGPRSAAWAHYDRDFGGAPKLSDPIARPRYRADAERIEPDEGIRSSHRDDPDYDQPRRAMPHAEPARSPGYEPIRRRLAEMEPPRRTLSDNHSIPAAEVRDPSRDARRRAEELAERLSVATVEERYKPAV